MTVDIKIVAIDINHQIFSRGVPWLWRSQKSFFALEIAENGSPNLKIFACGALDLSRSLGDCRGSIFSWNLIYSAADINQVPLVIPLLSPIRTKEG